MKARARLLLPLLPTLARAAPPWRIWLITYRGWTEVEQGFVEHFKSRGLAAEFTHRDIALDPARLPAVVAEIRAARPDLVHCWGSPVTLGVAGPWQGVDPARYLTELPIVFSLVASPVGAGIAPSLASSGRNLTGVTHLPPVAAQLGVLSSYRGVRRIGALYSANEPNSRAVLDELGQAARARGVELLRRPFASDGTGKPLADGAPGLLAELQRAGAEWLYLPPDSFLTTQLKGVVLPAAEALRLPSLASTEQQVAAGALLGLVSRYRSVGQFAAYKAEQILREGRAPASLPIETLSRFALQLRMPLARRLKLLPPLALVHHAELLEDEAHG